MLGATQLLDADLTLEAVAAILVENGVTTSAIEGERLDVGAVRSLVARHLGLPTAGLPTPPRAVDGLIEVLLDATRHFTLPLTKERLFGWQASLFPTGYSDLHRIRTGTLRGNEPIQVILGPMGRERIHFTAPPREGLEQEFSTAMANRGLALLGGVPGVRSVRMGRGVENPQKFMLLVEWATMDAHTAFKGTAAMNEFRALLKPFSTAGAMEHFTMS